MKALFKWLAGIAATVIAGVLIWQLTHQAPQPVTPTQPVKPQTGTTPAAQVCRVSGAVYDRETNRPLAGIEVRYLRLTHDPDEWLHEIRSKLATTGPDGRFSADCTSVETENFPLRLELVSRQWRSRFQTNELVRQGEQRSDVNIYVSDRLLRQQ